MVRETRRLTIDLKYGLFKVGDRKNLKRLVLMLPKDATEFVDINVVLPTRVEE